jgi:ABC-type amino acid transport substrate-binding protein
MRLLFVIFCSLCAVGAAAANLRPLRIGVENNSEPLSFVNQSGKIDGFSAEFLGEVARVGGFEIKLVPGPWRFLLDEFHAGRIDALANTTRNDERRKDMDFTIGHAF